MINASGKEVEFQQPDTERAATFIIHQQNGLRADISNYRPSSGTSSKVKISFRGSVDIANARLNQSGNVEVLVKSTDKYLGKSARLDNSAYPNGLGGQWVTLDKLAEVAPRESRGD